MKKRPVIIITVLAACIGIGVAITMLWGGAILYIPKCVPRADRSMLLPCMGYSNGETVADIPEGLPPKLLPPHKVLLFMDEAGKIRSARTS